MRNATFSNPRPQDGANPRRFLHCYWAWPAPLLVCATLLAYFPAIHGGMLWDDAAHVTRPDLQSWHGLVRIWTDLGATEQYYPFLHSFFWLQHRLWGDATVGYHLVGILLHASAACLLAAVLRRLSIPGAWLAAFLFALHPVAVESVAWIAEQKNTLSLVFYLASALVYLRFDGQRHRPSYGIALGLFLLALLTKSVTATLPAALLVVLWWQRGRLGWRRDIAPLLPWLALGAAMGVFTAWVERNYVGARGTDFELSLLERCLLCGRIIWFYLGKLVWPANLIFIYPRWQVDPAKLAQWLFPVAALALLAGLWLLRRRTRAPLAAYLFFVGSLFPVLGFFNVYPFEFSFVADHWQYLPCLSIIALAAAALAPPTGEPFPAAGKKAQGGAVRLRVVRRLLAAAVLGLLGVLTWRQSRNYRSLPVFYSAILERNPDCWMAHTNLGEFLREEGRIREAADHFQAALRLHPEYPIAHDDLGLAWRALGRTNDAIAEHEEAVRLRPGYAKAWNNLGGDWMVAGRLPEAVAAYERALRSKADYPEAEGDLAYALFKSDRLPDAIFHYETALRLKPDFPEAHNNLATILVRMGQIDEAIAHYAEAVKLRPGYLSARANLAAVLHAAGREDEAQEQLEAIAHLKAGQK
jgi:protein O-mannosyl-transferase